MMVRKNKNSVVSSKDLDVISSKPIEQLYDRVSDIAQKEGAMLSSGVTRRKVYDVIASLLTAEVEVRVYDKESREWVVSTAPDVEKRTKGAELALKAFGDLKEFTKVEAPKTYNTVIYQWKT